MTGIGSTDRVIKGKQYNKGVLAFKIIYEAFHRLKLKAFKRWLYEENKKDIMLDYLEFPGLLQLIDDSNKKQVLMLQLNHVNVFYSSFYTLIKTIYSKLGPVGLFSNSFIEMTHFSLDYIKWSHTGNWYFHVQASESTLVWLLMYY